MGKQAGLGKDSPRALDSEEVTLPPSSALATTAGRAARPSAPIFDLQENRKRARQDGDMNFQTVSPSVPLPSSGSPPSPAHSSGRGVGASFPLPPLLGQGEIPFPSLRTCVSGQPRGGLRGLPWQRPSRTWAPFGLTLSPGARSLSPPRPISPSLPEGQEGGFVS